MKTWQQTKIWEKLLTLDGSEVENIQTFLKCNLPAIELILKDGSPSTKDFTFHDSQHSYRVAERMIEVCSQDNFDDVLNAYELAVMLLASYLHDIGMTPSLSKSQSYFNYLFSGISDALSEFEIDEFENWVDSSKYQTEIPIPIKNGISALEAQSLANNIIKHYTRYKHNDWSENWIKENLAAPNGLDSGLYLNYIEDLISICRSHHYGLEELTNDRFNPILISPQYILHRRFIAMCLRLADVLEIDPERTPDILIKHRAISKDSLVYWEKDKHITLAITSNKVSLYARPSEAYLHKAIAETAKEISHELQLCNYLKDTKPLSTFPPHNNLKHKWEIHPNMYSDIKPLNDQYEYIEGSIRPNSEKLISILGGVELYGDELLAIREVLQNAIDANTEKMLYDYFESGGKTSYDSFINTATNYSIEIRLIRHTDDSIWLTFEDTGVGMTKEIIVNNFLVSGANENISSKKLKRLAQKAGIQFERIGRFGIGALSYFMIGDQLIIDTRRCLQASDHEPNGWSFTLDGISDFGQLRKTSRSKNGTKISIRLRKEFLAKYGTEIDNKIGNFLKKLINYSPCLIEFHSIATSPMIIPKGWTLGEQKITEDFLSNNRLYFDNKSFEKKYVDKLQLNEQYGNSTALREVAEQAAAVLNYIVDSATDNQLGYRYRITVPYFKLKTGQSVVYFDECLEEDGIWLKPLVKNGNFEYYNLGFEFLRLQTSMQGINVALNNHFPDPGVLIDLQFDYISIEIDFIDTRHFNVDASRNGITVKESAKDSFEQISRHIKARAEYIILELDKKLYYALNAYSIYKSLSSQHNFEMTNGYSAAVILNGKNKWVHFNNPAIKYELGTQSAFIKDESIGIEQWLPIQFLKGDFSQLRIHDELVPDMLDCQDLTNPRVICNSTPFKIHARGQASFLVGYVNASLNIIATYTDGRHFDSKLYYNRDFIKELWSSDFRDVVSEIVQEAVEITPETEALIFDKYFPLFLSYLCETQNSEFWSFFSKANSNRVATAWKSFFASTADDGTAVYVVNINSDQGFSLTKITASSMQYVDSSDSH